MCTNKSITLSEVVQSQGAVIKFRRQFDRITLDEWLTILHHISTVTFTHEHDKVAWKWEASGLFSVKSLYKMLNFRGVIFPNSMIGWTLPVPPKIKTFMWLVARNKLLTKKNLSKKGWPGSTKYQFCSQEETTNHLFLKCPLTQQIWFWMGQSQHYFSHWQNITDIIEFACSLKGKSKLAFLTMFSALCWTVWKLRNDSCFNNVPNKTFRTIILLIISLLTYWAGIIKRSVRDIIQTDWMPEDVDMIPLQVWDPAADVEANNMQLVVYRGPMEELKKLTLPSQ